MVNRQLEQKLKNKFFDFFVLCWWQKNPNFTVLSAVLAIIYIWNYRSLYNMWIFKICSANKLTKVVCVIGIKERQSYTWLLHLRFCAIFNVYSTLLHPYDVNFTGRGEWPNRLAVQQLLPQFFLELLKNGKT